MSAMALRIKPKATFFWRLEDRDGSYTLAPTVLRPGRGDRNFLGVEPALEVGYVMGPHVTFTGFVARFADARYFADNPPDRDITYVEATLAFRL